MDKATARHRMAQAAAADGVTMNARLWQLVQAHEGWAQYVASADNEWAGDEAQLLLARAQRGE